jgi:hypothetical protein
MESASRRGSPPKKPIERCPPSAMLARARRMARSPTGRGMGEENFDPV